VEQQLLLHLPAAAQRAAQAPLKPPKGVPLSAAFRSAQLAGPRVSMQRYSVAVEWKRSLEQFFGGASRQAASSSGSSGSSGGSSGSGSSATAVAVGQSSQPLLAPPPPAAAAAGASSGSSGDGQPPGSALSALLSSMRQSSSAVRPVLPQDKPAVALVTAAGAITQANPGSADPTGERGVESHKLVRVLRGYRDNPQVGCVCMCV
jgi:hypothetical protein